MTPGPKAAAEIVVHEFDLLRAPVDAVDLIHEIGTTQGWFSGMADEDTYDKCDSWLNGFLKTLQKEYSDRATEGRFTRFAFNPSTTTYIQGWCYPEPSDSEQVQAAKAIRAQHSLYMAFIADISDREFEAVCAGVLGLLGCENPVLTPRSGDQGIDFFGRLDLEGKLGAPFVWPSVDRNFTTWLVGQAKQYDGKVSTTWVRELAGSVALARAGVSADNRDSLAALKVRLFDPIFYLFFTTGRLTRDTRQLAKRSGIIALEGEDIAALLADRSVGLIEKEFDLQEAIRWVERHKD